MTSTVPNVPHLTLNNGVKIPAVGMGCWMGYPGGGQEVEELVKNALKVGYRHFDTAAFYSNEEHVGKAIRESGIPRNEIFVTTKLPNTHHHQVAEAFEQSLNSLNIDYIDLYLMHWPQAMVDGRTLAPEEHPTFVETWKDMEKLLDTGKVRAIGVSNFSLKTLQVLLPHCKVVPAINQVELQPCLPSLKLKKYCEDNGIILTAFSPLGKCSSADNNPALMNDSDILRVAANHNAAPAQILVSWAVQRGTIVIPKSGNVERMTKNITLITLTDEEMDLINNIHKKPNMHRTLLTHYCQGETCFGWTFEQLGWPYDIEGRVKEGSVW
ncbi:Aldo/keto reductase [Panus rudis PR-1116 ss-1]|nr:Aldo/keto reductase [Panus rudis PR-1116 ss-1]